KTCGPMYGLRLGFANLRPFGLKDWALPKPVGPEGLAPPLPIQLRTATLRGAALLYGRRRLLACCWPALDPASGGEVCRPAGSGCERPIVRGRGRPGQPLRSPRVGQTLAHLPTGAS